MVDGKPFCPTSYLLAAAEAFGNSPAILQGKQVIGFADMAGRVLKLTSILQARGARMGDVVGLHLGNVWEYVALELAVPNTGAIVLPLSLTLGEYELEQTLRRSGARFLVCEADRANLVQKVCARLTNGPQVLFLSEIVHAIDEAPTAPVLDGDRGRIVEIAVTSGTSGLPKLASRSAAQKQATFEGFTGRLQAGTTDRVLAMSPFTQGVGSMSLYTFRRGASQVMLGTSGFVPADVLELAAEMRVTMLIGVPTNIHRLMNAPKFNECDLSSCRVTAVAGALLPSDVAEGWEKATGSKVCIFYGSVDAGQLCVSSPTDPAAKRWHTVGRPHDCCEILIQGAQKEALGQGQIGEICMRGATVQDGYWGESRSAYEDDGWAHLGDLGYLDPEGYLHVVGRSKDIIIRGGSNINPYEVEAVLRRHPDIRDVCIVGKADDDLGERAVAFVTVRPGGHFFIGTLRDFLANSGLAKYKWPEFVEHVDEIPLSGPGKVNREALRKRLVHACERAPEPK